MLLRTVTPGLLRSVSKQQPQPYPCHVHRTQAQNLIKAGYKVIIWNRSADKCDPLKAAGAEVG